MQHDAAAHGGGVTGHRIEDQGSEVPVPASPAAMAAGRQARRDDVRPERRVSEGEGGRALWVSVGASNPRAGGRQNSDRAHYRPPVARQGDRPPAEPARAGNGNDKDAHGLARWLSAHQVPRVSSATARRRRNGRFCRRVLLQVGGRRVDLAAPFARVQLRSRGRRPIRTRAVPLRENLPHEPERIRLRTRGSSFVVVEKDNSCREEEWSSRCPH